MSGEKIKIEFDTEDVMEDQRKTICIKGQEIPTWQFVWEQLHQIELNIKRMIIATIIGVSVILLVSVAIAMK